MGIGFELPLQGLLLLLVTASFEFVFPVPLLPIEICLSKPPPSECPEDSLRRDFISSDVEFSVCCELRDKYNNKQACHPNSRKYVDNRVFQFPISSKCLTSVMVEILSCETVRLDSVLVSSMEVNTSSTVDKTSWEPSFEHLSRLDVPKNQV